ncbi:MAG: GntR family transcriptional regulator [Rikenellaceae bacterium]|nr:GntR family transcriptional regulator [Rikenellaceae bacterium]
MKLSVDHNSSTPLHVQAETLLRSLIEKEVYKNGRLLPREVDLASQLNISRNTLRQAITTLVNEGLLVRKKGYGTKVAQQRVLSEAGKWMSFSQEMKTMGIEVHNFELHIAWAQPTADIAAFFNLAPQTRVLWLRRLRGKKDFPFVYFISAFNPEIGLTGNENFNQPLYEILARDYNIAVKRSKEEISAAGADEFIAAKLEISPGDPILVRKRYVYDANGLPVEYNTGYYRADSFTYTIECV